MKKTFKHFILLSSIITVSACSSVKLDADKTAVKMVDVTQGIGSNGVPAPANRSIYFDLDGYGVRMDGQTVINSQGAFLVQNPGQRILIQGHTDERGTAEYNIALGQRRSESVRQALALRGVQANQMESVSFGKEKPKALGAFEAAWSQNRRADIVY